jgi:hypothetical protein
MKMNSNTTQSHSLIKTFKEAIVGNSLPKTPLGPTNKFLIQQGIFYTFFGIVALFHPSFITKALFVPEPLTHRDESLLRPLGIAIIIIGYFYIQGARESSYHFIASTIFDRLTIMPICLIVTYFYGTPMQLCLAFGILDPLLAILTYRSLVNDETISSTTGMTGRSEKNK